MKGITGERFGRQAAFLEVDVHGMTREQAFTAIDAKLRRADGAYRTCAWFTATTAEPCCVTRSAPTIGITAKSNGSSWA